jgi:quercetin dioxygenase-like cupin family protein
MKKFACSVIAVAVVLSVAAARAQDAVKVDAKHYTVLLENDQVRVLKAQYGPGEKSAMHSHPNTVAVFLTDGKGKFTYPDGKSEDITMKAGTANWHDAVTHLPENTGDAVFEVIVVELKTPPAK